ncbi:MAG: hypothetical protein SFU56_04570 [Capsulimonadales bacterium]|nr:hypothetical protein [Capsulimonadales bacterium]
MSGRNIFGGAPMLAATLLLTIHGTALAQGPDGPPPGFGGPGGNGGPGFPGGQGPMGRRPMGPPEVSLATAPVRVLATSLKLTEEQQSRIQRVQEEMRENAEARRPPQGDGAPEGDPRAALRAMNEKASKTIESLLTEEQRKRVPGLLRAWNVVRGLGLPLETASELNLTAEQLTVLEKAVKARRPMPGQGGFPGRGAGRPGQPGQPGGPGGFDGPGGPPRD